MLSSYILASVFFLFGICVYWKQHYYMNKFYMRLRIFYFHRLGHVNQKKTTKRFEEKFWQKVLKKFTLLTNTAEYYAFHNVKSAQRRSFSWSVFSRIWTEYRHLLCKSPYPGQIRENTDQKNLRICTFLTFNFSVLVYLKIC